MRQAPSIATGSPRVRRAHEYLQQSRLVLPEVYFLRQRERYATAAISAPFDLCLHQTACRVDNTRTVTVTLTLDDSPMRTDFVIDTLEQALYARQPERDGSLVRHSDR